MAENNPLREMRAKFNLTRKQLSEICFDIPIRTIQDWEIGKRTPPTYLINLINSRLEQYCNQTKE